MQYGGVRISNVLHDLEIIKNSSTLNKTQMSMLKMLTLMPETFCQFSQISIKLQSFNCMQNDRMIKAQLFYKKCLSMSQCVKRQFDDASKNVLSFFSALNKATDC